MLYVHPFAEEMNKSRRMAALQARAFAASGWDVLLMDLHGCGDSSGDFGDATVESFGRMMSQAGLRWLAARTTVLSDLGAPASVPCWPATVAARTSHAHPLLLWQPTVSGHRFIQQFFRSRVISVAGRRRTSLDDRWVDERVAAGTVVEVAGYQLSPDLILPLERSEMPSAERIDRKVGGNRRCGRRRCQACHARGHCSVADFRRRRHMQCCSGVHSSGNAGYLRMHTANSSKRVADFGVGRALPEQAIVFKRGDDELVSVFLPRLSYRGGAA